MRGDWLTQIRRVAGGRPDRDRAADELMDGYVAWREASAEVRAAYDRWYTSESGAPDLDFVSYLAALDREERAAHVYERQIERIRRVIPELEEISSPRAG
jgi:hypothetical protein